MTWSQKRVSMIDSKAFDHIDKLLKLKREYAFRIGVTAYARERIIADCGLECKMISCACWINSLLFAIVYVGARLVRSHHPYSILS